MAEVADQQAPVEQAAVNERVCEFYLQPRGCIKGDKCDFKHPLAPGGGAATRVCEYFLKPRGCIKGDSCDFLHPDIQNNPRLAQQASASAKNLPCNFFGSPRGCIKGDACDFVHPMGGMQGGMQGMQGMGGMGGMGGGMQGGNAPRACEFFQSPRGCIKGNACDFAHIPAQQQQPFFGAPQMGGMGGMNPMMGGGQMGRNGGMSASGPVNKMGKLMVPKLCDFFASERGCIKADSCEFIHQKTKPCEFAATPRGCRKGKFCDFLHPEGSTDESEAGSGKMPKAAPAARYAPY